MPGRSWIGRDGRPRILEIITQEEQTTIIISTMMSSSKEAKKQEKKKSKKDKKAKKEKKRRVAMRAAAEDDDDEPHASVENRGVQKQQDIPENERGCAVEKSPIRETKDSGADEDENLKQQEPAEEDVDAEGGNKKRRKRKRKRKKEGDGANNEDADDPTGGVPAPQADEEDDEDVVQAAKKKASQVDRTVYVEGIPFAATPDQVRQFFVDAGLSDLVDLRLPVWQDSGRLRGYGHVVFESEDSYRKALTELSGKYLLGRYLTLQPAHKPKDVVAVAAGSTSSKPSKTIVLHNLSYKATEQDIEPIVVSQFGEVAAGGVRVVRHSGGDQQSKGFAYVEFQNVEAAVSAVQAGITIKGRPCRIDYDHGRVRGSFRTADRKLWQKEYGRLKKKEPQQE